MRTFLLNIGLMGGLFILWYSYAPIDHKMRVPAEIRQTVSAFDNLASSGMIHLTALIDDVSVEEAREENEAVGPLLMGGVSEGIEIHSERMTGRTAEAETRPDMFTGLSLRNATLAESRLDGFNLDFTDFRGAALANVTLHRAKGQDARFDDALIHRADFSRAELRRARFDRALMAHAVFDGAEVIEGSFSDALLRGGSFSGATMAGSRFDRAHFEHTDLRQVDFGAASFKGAVFEGARLHGTSLAAADLSGADLSTAVGLSQEQLGRACGDADTKLPDGFTLPNCAPVDPTRLAQF